MCAKSKWQDAGKGLMFGTVLLIYPKRHSGLNKNK